MNASQIVEAVLFASDAPLTADEIARADEALDEDRVEEALQHLRAEYDDAHRAFELVEVAEGYQILTRAEFAPYLERFDNVPRPTRLSGPALETLAIIAYRQPLGRVEIEYIRGVGASGVIRTLQERRLIDVVGRDEGLGRPLLYGTTAHFLEHFGFRSLEDLPRPEELPIILRERVPLGNEEEAEGETVDPNQETLALGDAGATETPEGAAEASEDTPSEDGAPGDSLAEAETRGAGGREGQEDAPDDEPVSEDASESSHEEVASEDVASVADDPAHEPKDDSDDQDDGPESGDGGPESGQDDPEDAEGIAEGEPSHEEVASEDVRS